MWDGAFKYAFGRAGEKYTWAADTTKHAAWMYVAHLEYGIESNDIEIVRLKPPGGRRMTHEEIVTTAMLLGAEFQHRAPARGRASWSCKGPAIPTGSYFLKSDAAPIILPAVGTSSTGTGSSQNRQLTHGASDNGLCARYVGVCKSGSVTLA